MESICESDGHKQLNPFGIRFPMQVKHWEVVHVKHFIFNNVQTGQESKIESI